MAEMSVSMGWLGKCARKNECGAKENCVSSIYLPTCILFGFFLLCRKRNERKGRDVE